MTGLGGVTVTPLTVHSDHRGLLVELFRAPWVSLASGGQVYLTTAAAGAVKGNHFHRRKTEWFCVLKGMAEAHLVDVNGGESRQISLDGRSPAVLSVPPMVAHSVRNTGTETLMLLAYITEAFDPRDPDTYPWEVQT